MPDEDLILRARIQDEISAGVRNIRRELGDLEATAARVGPAGTKAGAGLDVTTAASARAKAAASQLNSSLITMSNSLGATVEREAKRGALALGVFGTATALFGLKASSEFQQSEIAFETLLGSVSAGQQLFKQLQDINVKTPFQLNEIAPATQLLLRYGVAQDKVVPVLKSLLDAAALSGDPAANLQRLALATGQVVSQGRLLGQDARQLAESGINAYTIYAQKLGLTPDQVRKLGAEGKLSSDIFINALINEEGDLSKLKGGAEKLSQTLFGQVSNLKDAIRIRLSNDSAPLTAELTKDMPHIVQLVGTAADQIGAPLFRLVGTLATEGVKLLPLLGGPLEHIFDGLGRILTAMDPAFSLLAPLSDQIGASIDDLVRQLLPATPDIIKFFLALVGVLPQTIKFMGDLIPLAMPLLRVATALLTFGPTKDVMAGLLIVLLGYSKISGLASGLMAFGRAVGWIGTQAEASGAKADIAYGKFAALGEIAAGVLGISATAGAVTKGKSSAANTAGFIGSTALVGAGIGSIVPGVGTLVGAGAGALVGGVYAGLGAAFGDPVVPGRIAAAHGAANVGQGSSMRHITSGIRDFGVRSSSSGHVRGTAVDVAGPGLTGYVQNVRARGGWAVLEGAGKGMHAHADFGDPAGRPTGGGSDGGWGSGVTIAGPLIGHITANTQLDYEGGLERALRRVEVARYRRSYSPQMAGL